MKFRRAAAVYSIIVSLGMIGIWIVLLVTGQDPQLQEELQTIPFSISMAITSDILTALALLTAGTALLKGYAWSVKAIIFALGLLFYSVINAAGFYGQRGEIPFLAMFIIIFILGVVFTIPAFRSNPAS